MMEELRKAVILAISECFMLPVYGQHVPQGVKKPCFTVELKGVEQKRLLGRRMQRKACFAVRFFDDETKTVASDSLATAEKLYEILAIVGREEKFSASGMKHEKLEDGVNVQVEYEYHILFTEEETALMERLEYNGKETAGYEEKDDIQQGTAE